MPRARLCLKSQNLIVSIYRQQFHHQRQGFNITHVFAHKVFTIMLPIFFMKTEKVRSICAVKFCGCEIMLMLQAAMRTSARGSF